MKTVTAKSPPPYGGGLRRGDRDVSFRLTKSNGQETELSTSPSPNPSHQGRGIKGHCLAFPKWLFRAVNSLLRLVLERRFVHIEWDIESPMILRGWAQKTALDKVTAMCYTLLSFEPLKGISCY